VFDLKFLKQFNHESRRCSARTGIQQFRSENGGKKYNVFNEREPWNKMRRSTSGTETRHAQGHLNMPKSAFGTTGAGKTTRPADSKGKKGKSMNFGNRPIPRCSRTKKKRGRLWKGGAAFGEAPKMCNWDRLRGRPQRIGAQSRMRTRQEIQARGRTP